MDRDKYKVDILHYTNPHLLWALVAKEGGDGYNFEQIGIYGVLPLDVTIDYDGNLETSKCKEWLPAVYVAMKKILLDAAEVWFSVTFLDRTTSIFDDNIHKYGDLTIKLKNGETVSMLQRLLDTGFVAEDVQYFHQNLRTKLDYVTTVSVINKIKENLKTLNMKTQKLEDILDRHTSIFQKTVELEETSPRELDVGIRRNAHLVLQKQISDLNLCKDVDEEEESAGRANSIKTPRSIAGLMNKLDLMKTSVSSDEKPYSVVKGDKCKRQDVTQSRQESLYVDPGEWPKGNANKGKKSKEANKGKKMIAFGPPGMNPMQFHFTEVKIEEKKIDDDIKKASEESNTVLKEVKNLENQKLLEKADSEISVRSNYMDILKLKSKYKKFDANNSLTQTTKEKYCEDKTSPTQNAVKKSSMGALHRKMKFLKEQKVKTNDDDSSSTAKTDSSARQGDDSDSESILSIVDKFNISDSIKKEATTEPELVVNKKNNVNPFKNLDNSRSVFVEKMVTPTVMVHTKHGNTINPVTAIRDIPFGTNIHVVLRNMSVQRPMRLQAVSWPTILRGHSLFLVSPYDSGKTLGYLPAVCRLVNDCKEKVEELSLVRLTCIIVGATANSVSHLEQLCKMFLHEARIFACYTGMSDVSITTSILNGCDILICTPTMLVRLFRENLGLDIRNLNMFVIDDCERIEEVYQNEIKFCVFKVKEMMKSRANKEFKVQYIVMSRIWCNFMSSLAKKAPDSIVCIAAFQECVLYSEVNTSVEFLKKEDKVEAMFNFLDGIDKSKKTVIACRSDDEVHLIKKMLTDLKHVVFACDSTMTIQELYSIDFALSEYQEPLLAPILVCCDANLTHLNITDAHHLIHFSLPELFSTFCRRFAVLIENYPSIFNKEENGIKIKILVENSNVEQLPKILNFIKRCSDNVPTVLEEINATVMKEKDLKKAENFVPLCGLLLSLGKCPDIWNCKQRHSIFENYDEPKTWMPRVGTVTFKILHYHSAVHYSARMISYTVNNEVNKYPQTYASLSIKLGMYYSKEINRKLHGVAKPGDICAVSLKQDLFARCQVMKVLKYTHNNLPSVLLINLIDEEKYEMARDTCLYHLPDELKSINTHVAKVILANIAPVDKDITYSELALNQLKTITEKNTDFYMRGRISLVIGNCIFVDTLEACKDLSALNETVVKNNFKNELLDGHAVVNTDHLSALEKLGEGLDFVRRNEVSLERVDVPKPIKILPKARWAHLESDQHAPVYYMYAKNPGLIFVQHVKFQDCLQLLLKDIKKYVAENPDPVTDVKEGDIVLAEFPDDSAYERARIDSAIDDDKVKCFFVDLGDWRLVPTDKLLSISEKLITQLPFQAIECRLVGVKPIGSKWSQFSTNWLVDQCYASTGDIKYLYAKRFTKEKAEFTDGSRYGIGLIDTYNGDVYINKMMIDANLAEENEEIDFLGAITIEDNLKSSSDSDSSAKIALTERKKANTSEIVDIVDKVNNTKAPSVVDASLHDNSSTDSASDISTEKSINAFGHKKTKNKNSSIKDDGNNTIEDTESYTETSDDNEFAQADSLAKIEKRIAVDNSTSPQNTSIIEKKKAMLALLKNFNKSKESSKASSILSEENTSKSNDDIKNCDLTIKPKVSPNKKKVKRSGQDDLKVTKENQLAVIDTRKSTRNNEQDSDYTNLNTDISTAENFRANQQAVMQILKANPLRSVPLVEDDDIDDDRWDVGQPTQMLFGSMLGPNSTQTNDDQTPIPPFFKAIVEKSFTQTKNDQKAVPSNLKTLEGKSSTQTKHDHKSVPSNSKSIEGKSDPIPSIDTAPANKSAPTLPRNLTPTKFSDSQAKTIITLPKTNDGDKLRKPKLVWRQKKDKATVKILLITDKYDIEFKEKHLKFNAKVNDEEYGFEFELYGVIDVKKSSHANKGQYIQVNLQKLLARNWLTLSKGIRKWIVYDVDNIDISSDDESDSAADISNLQKTFYINTESESDDDFDDDTNAGYRKHY